MASPLLIRRILLQRTAAWAPTDIAGLLAWYKLDALSLSNNDPIGTVPDSSGNGITGTQTTAAKKPTFKTAQQNGRAAAWFDGVDDGLDISTLSAAAGSFTFFMVVNPTALGAGERRLFDSQTGRLILTARAGDWQWYDGAYHDIAAAATGWQILVWVFAGGGNGEIFRNGVSLGSAAYSQMAIGGSTFIGQNSVGEEDFYVGYVGEYGVYNSALSAGNRGKVESYLNSSSRWGIY